jgi:hypothetical protein
LEDKLGELTSKLKTVFGDRVVSVILYGSAAAGDWQERTSDFNVLCVVKTVDVDLLAKAAPVFAWWMKQGNVAPVLFSEEEARHSTDCFPMEFHDMQEHRRVLLGSDLVAELQIDLSFYRALVEREFRSKELRLRQKSVELLEDPQRLGRLLIDSISTFCALGRHALILSGQPPHWKKQEILTALSEAIGRPLNAAREVLSLRETHSQAAPAKTLELLGHYLSDVDAMVRFVDGLAK